MVPVSGSDAIQEQTARRRPGGRSARLRDAVMDATYSLALERGFSGFSVSDIAERAGVHQTSIYRRWGTRERLLVDAVHSRVDRAAPIPDTGSLRGDLRSFLEGVAAFMRTPEGLLLSRLAVTPSEDRTLLETRTRYWQRAITNAATMFERAAARGEVSPDVDGPTSVEILVAPLWYRALVTGQDLDEAFLEAVVRVALEGLRAHA